MVARLPDVLWPKRAPYGMLVELSADGEPLRSLHDPGGWVLRERTAAVERDGVPYLGSLTAASFGTLSLP